MIWSLAAAGLMLLALVVFDLVKTTPTLHGAGPVALRLGKFAGQRPAGSILGAGTY